mgnify:CR=1 FL=1
MEEKQQYVDSAENDKERYAKELTAYKQTDAYKALKKSQKRKESCKKLKENIPSCTLDDINQIKDDNTSLDIPIFTEEFLDHNKLREAELRQLRKSNTDYEQQNSILEKLIENTKSAIHKLEEETVQQKCQNQTLQQHLDEMRLILTNGFKEISLPGLWNNFIFNKTFNNNNNFYVYNFTGNDDEKPTLETIDSYVTKLHELLLAQNMNSPLYVRVREVVQQLNLHGWPEQMNEKKEEKGGGGRRNYFKRLLVNPTSYLISFYSSPSLLLPSLSLSSSFFTLSTYSFFLF